MKLIVPALEIEGFEGFTSERDIFNRAEYAKKLTEIISNTDDELVVGLDAPWGEGKTTFVKMWRGMLNDQGISSVYFDAFKNDFLEDPLLALIGEINILINDLDKDIKDEFKSTAVGVLKAIGKASIRIGLRAATAGVLDDTALEGAGAEGEATSIADKYITERIDNLEKDKSAIEHFQNILEEIVKTLDKNTKLIFIIDELDRCKPSFALDLLEKIKHIFSLPGVVFILVMNKDQMSEIIKSRYGSGIDSTKYLQKFIHVWTGLPKAKEQHTNDARYYLTHCLTKMEYDFSTDNDDLTVDLYSQLIDHYNMSFREIERSLTNFAILYNITEGRLARDYDVIAVYLSVIKVMFPSSFSKIRNGTLPYNDVIKETELEKFTIDHWNGKPEGHYLKWLLRYHISDDEDVESLINEDKNYADHRHRHERVAVSYLSKLLDSFRNY
ncbi:MAG: P-loop NTPase fold protein [Candidatus Thiodiazotropha sp.]